MDLFIIVLAHTIIGYMVGIGVGLAIQEGPALIQKAKKNIRTLRNRKERKIRRKQDREFSGNIYEHGAVYSDLLLAA